jgi:hypothetical protein
VQEDADCTFVPETRGQSAVILAASSNGTCLVDSPLEQVYSSAYNLASRLGLLLFSKRDSHAMHFS